MLLREYGWVTRYSLLRVPCAKPSSVMRMGGGRRNMVVDWGSLTHGEVVGNKNGCPFCFWIQKYEPDGFLRLVG